MGRDRTDDPTNRCFEEGADARARGLRQTDNPYDLRTDNHKEWLAGWSATFDLDEEGDPASNRDQPADDPGSCD